MKIKPYFKFLNLICFLLRGFSSNPSYAVVTQLLHGPTFGRLYIMSSAHTSEAAGKEKGAALSLYTILYTIFMNAGGTCGKLSFSRRFIPLQL